MARTVEDETPRTGVGAGMKQALRAAVAGDPPGTSGTTGASHSPDSAGGPDHASAPPGDAGEAAPLTLRRLGREALPIWLVTFVTYALTLSSVPALTHDSLTYVHALEDGGDGLWHPHHLIYNAVGSVWLSTVRAFGVTSDGIKVVAIANSALGATCAVLCYALLRDRARLPRKLALAGTAGAALSFGLWFYSVSVEVYVLPLTLLLAAMFVLLSPRLTVRHLVAVGLLQGVAVLGHQIHVLFAVVVVAVVLSRRHAVGAAAVRRWLAGWAAAASAVVLAGYGLVMALVVRPTSPAEANGWLTRYAGNDTFWVPPGPDTVPRAAFGAARAVVGGHFLFRLDWVEDRLASALPGKSLTDEAFLVRELAPVAAVALILTALAGGLLLAGSLVRGVRRRASVPAPARGMAWALAAWVVTYSLFFLVWEPSNVEFWIPQVTCVWLITAALCARSTGTAGTSVAVPARRVTALVAAAALVGLSNLAGSILPAIDAANDIYAHRFSALSHLVGEGDAVVVDRPHLTVGYNRRHTRAVAIPAEPYSATVGSVDPSDDFSAEAVMNQVGDVVNAGHRVAVEPELIDNPINEEERGVARALREAYGDRWYRAEPVPGVTWIVIDPR